MSPMLLDSIVGIVILLSALFAFFRGFVKEMLTIIGLGGAFASAYVFGPMLVPFFNEKYGVVPQGEVTQKAAENAKIWGLVPPHIMSAFTSYAVAFFSVFILLTLAGMAIASMIKSLGLGPLDKILGVAFGFLRGFLLVFLIYMPFAYFMPAKDMPQWAQDSVSVPLLQQAYDWGNGYLKDEKARAEENGGKDNPDSLGNKIKAKLDGALDKKDDAVQDLKENARELDDKAHNVTQDILNDSERKVNP